ATSPTELTPLPLHDALPISGELPCLYRANQVWQRRRVVAPPDEARPYRNDRHAVTIVGQRTLLGGGLTAGIGPGRAPRPRMALVDIDQRTTIGKDRFRAQVDRPADAGCPRRLEHRKRAPFVDPPLGLRAGAMVGIGRGVDQHVASAHGSSQVGAEE